MSEEVAVETTQVDESQSTEAQQGQESPSTSSTSSTPSILQTETGSSPLDSIFSEEVMSKIPDGPQKNWLLGQKSGDGLLKGIAGFQKLVGQKGFERPAEGSDAEAIQAFDAKMRELKQVPQDADGYKLAPPEGFELPDDLASSLKEYGLETGKSPEELNADIGKFVEIRNQLNEIESQQRVQEEGKKLHEVIDGFDKGKGTELSNYLVNSGVNLEDGAYENAEIMRWVNKSMELERKVAGLTGEDVSVAVNSSNGSNTLDSLQTRLSELTTGDSEKALAFRDPMVNRQLNTQAKQEYLEINRLISQIKRK